MLNFQEQEDYLTIPIQNRETNSRLEKIYKQQIYKPIGKKDFGGELHSHHPKQNSQPTNLEQDELQLCLYTTAASIFQIYVNVPVAENKFLTFGRATCNVGSEMLMTENPKVLWGPQVVALTESIKLMHPCHLYKLQQ